MNWDKVMDEEMATLDVNETWGLVQILEGQNVIGGYKWVYKVN